MTDTSDDFDPIAIARESLAQAQAHPAFTRHEQRRTTTTTSPHAAESTALDPKEESL